MVDTTKKVQLEKLKVMHMIIEEMEEDFFKTESTSEFLQRTSQRIEALITTDF